MSPAPPADATQVILGGGSVPQRLAQYEIVHKVGAGAMGVVYLARDVDLDRPVALKLLHDTEVNPVARQQAEERFLREARTAAQISHPNVAGIHQVGRAEGHTFLAMEWIDGGDLAQRAARGPMPWREAVAAVRDAAAGLVAAHARGLVHRDVKPSNLMQLAGSGTVKLVDFGLARLHELPSDLTATGSIIGTPAYLAPEVFRGEPAGPLADLYALACTAYHLLTGGAPYTGTHWVAVMNHHVSTPMPDPRVVVADIPEAVVRLVLRGAAKQPQQRQQDMAEMLADLQAALDGRSPPPRTAAAAPASPTVRVDLSTAAAPQPIAGTPQGPASAAVPKGNLPAALGPFVGRDGPGAQLIERLGQERLVTLTGPGGTGKTRLSQHIARRVASTYPDGVWLVELAALPPGGDAALATAAVLDVRESSGQSMEAAVVEHLGRCTLLLVLDNCEHLLDSAAALAARILAGCPGVQVLATSRQPLGIPGEATLPVPPMAVAEAGLAPEVLADVESVRLFVQRARAARPDFALTRDNAEAIAAICRRLDGLPLAIELAAARVKVLSVPQIGARLDDAFKLLAAGPRTLQPRQQTLRALIDWSWQLLDDAERRSLARLSVFAGEFGLEAAEAVLVDPADGDTAVDPLDALASLADKSLLVAADRGSTVRYSLLQTIRQYAAERLQGDDLKAALQRHARHYVEQVVAIRGRFDTAGHAAAEAELALEHEQARAALEAACAHQWLDVALPMAEALAWYWYQAGPLADGMARVARVLALEPPPSAETALLLRRGAALAIRCGRLDTAREWLEAGLAMARADGAVGTVGGILNTLGNLGYTQGRFEVAREHYSEALAIFRDSGLRENEVSTTSNLAGIERRLGRLDASREHYRRALALLQGSSNGRRIGHLKLNLGELEAVSGRTDVALPLLRESIEALRPYGEDWGIGLARMVLGGCALAVSDLARSREETEAGLALLRRDGDPGSIAHAVDQLARVALRERRGDDASAHAAEALTLRLQARNLPDIASSLNTWAALIADAHAEHAARLLGCADAVREAEHAPLDPPLQLEEQQLLARLAQRLGAERLARARAAGVADDPLVLAGALVGDGAATNPR